jgi:hypothetical protein
MAPGFFFLVGLLAADTNAAPPATNAPAAANSTNAPLVREISPGILEYHHIRLDKKNRRISFDATVNQRVGLIEYLLVNEKGKVHESLFATKVMPHDIHLAMLLIGLKEDEKSNANEPVPPSAIDSGYLQSAPKLKGSPVKLAVTWTQDGKKKEAAAEDWILNLKTNKPMSSGAWTYNGSLVEDGQFLADQDLSIVAVITDPTALVNNPREGYDDDQIWQVQDKVVPALDTPVELSITLADVPSPKRESAGSTPAKKP